MENIGNNYPTQEDLLQERMNGILPVIDIAGHPFYVDVRMNSIRPHDDFSTQGIPFSEFKDFDMIANFAWLFYNPRSHETVKNINLEKLYKIPKDWIVIEIPHPQFLDPYGCAVKNGWDVKETLKVYPIQANLKARIVPWEETSIPDIIKKNVQRRERFKARFRILNPDYNVGRKGPNR